MTVPLSVEACVLTVELRWVRAQVLFGQLLWRWLSLLDVCLNSGWLSRYSVSSQRCAGRRTAICCAGPLLSLLRPIARLGLKYHSGPSPGPKLRAMEQRPGGGPWGGPKKQFWTAIRWAEIPAHVRAARPQMRTSEERAGGGHQGAPKKRPWTTIVGAEIPARARAHCHTEIDGLGAARWRGYQGAAKKRPGTAIRGARYQPAPVRAARLKLRAPEQRASGGHQGAPKKQPGTAIREGRDTGACPRPHPHALARRPPRHPEKAAWDRKWGCENTGLQRYIGERVDEKSV